MNGIMRLKITLLGLVTLIVWSASQTAIAGIRVGNGGDHIRASYIRMGEAIVDYLVETEAGAALVREKGLNLRDLQDSLDINRVSVVDETLRDNSGSVVEAIGEPGLVKLNKEAWFQHFEKLRDVYYLVFHEMLRSAAVNDDGYVISKSLNPFPASRRVETRVVPVLPLIAEDNLASVFDLKSVTVGGTGCPKADHNLRLEFDQEKNILEIQPTAYRSDVTASRPTDVKSCQLAIPVKLPVKKRLVISQIDLLGTADLAAGGQANISFEAFLAGSKAKLQSRLIKATSDLKGRVLTRRMDVLKSKCGAPDIVRMNTGLAVKGSQSRLESFATSSISLYLSIEDCR